MAAENESWQRYPLPLERLLFFEQVIQPLLQTVTLLNGLFKFALHVVNL